MELLNVLAGAHWSFDTGVTAGFLLLILMVAPFLAMVICVATVAQNQGRNGLGWFFLSLLITPIFAILVLIAYGDTDAKRRQRAIDDERARNSVRNGYANPHTKPASLQSTNIHAICLANKYARPNGARVFRYIFVLY